MSLALRIGSVLLPCLLLGAGGPLVLEAAPAPGRHPGTGTPGTGADRDVAATSVLSWPIRPPPAVLRPFDPPSTPYGPGHRGVDLAGTARQLVRAAAAGVVIYAGPLAGRGVVSVQHQSGLRTTYEPLSAEVTGGQRVERGRPLGMLRPGHPGCPASACLHWGLRRGDQYLDPLQAIGSHRHHVRLLPWDLPTGPEG